MPTKWTQTLIPTMREDPTDAEVPSQRLMLRAGLIRRLGSGLYSYLPAGWRTLRKVMDIIRQEMDAAGAAELLLPTLHPLELWQKTGRDVAYGENLFTLTDRHGRTQALGPTHEEVVTDLVGSCISSYKDLPKCVYQIQTKFRDEFRPRFGVLRSREFQMKDAYSFHLRLEGAPGSGSLDETYQKMYEAYCRIFERCGVPYRIVEAESGPIGGSASHEFMVPSPTGEDVILQSDRGDYAANVEKCAIGKREIGPAFSGEAGAPPEAGGPEPVHTPACHTIDEVCAYFKEKLGIDLATSRMLKTMVCKAGDRWVVGVVRGDHDLNEAKLREASGFEELTLADDREARDAGFAIGFVGPHIAAQRRDVVLVVDPDVTSDADWVTGANEADYHVRGFDWRRDVLAMAERDRVRVADIRNALDGDPAPEDRGGGTLRQTRGIEVGHVFKLGSKYTEAMGVTVLDENNKPLTPIMGCYGIGVNRIVAGAIERAPATDGRPGGHDDSGIIWPASIAPYQVLITPIKYGGQAKEVADGIAGDLEAGGADVLIDDRAERPGVKFNDADLLGIPLRITIGDKGLKEGVVEIKARDGSTGDKGERVAIDQAVGRARELLSHL